MLIPDAKKLQRFFQFSSEKSLFNLLQHLPLNVVGVAEFCPDMLLKQRDCTQAGGNEVGEIEAPDRLNQQ